MLQLRLKTGLPTAGLSDHAAAVARRAATDGLVEAAQLDAGVAVLTARGRLLADAVIRDLVE